MGSASDCGVPGADGRGEPAASEMASGTKAARELAPDMSGGAGLFDCIRRPGKSIFVILLC